MDMLIQAYGEKLLQNKKGSIVAIEPSSGEILAMVSAPSFDPNLLVGRRNIRMNYPKLVLDPWATASLTSMLTGVISSGTATAAQIGRPAAGKTGTTDNERNVWFVGYVPQLATAVWIGDDANRRLGTGITGGSYAAPIWRDFMLQALKNEPVKYFPAASKFPKPSAK
jgi:membrane carboxypeptidase/penicillin-binding protein